MSVSSIMEQFQLVVKVCEDRKLIQKEALSSLQRKYEAAITENEQKIKTIMEKHRFYEDIHYTMDDLIGIYDKSINSIAELERKEYEERLERKIGDILSEKIINIQHYEMITEKDFEQCRDLIYKDRGEVAQLCQENRKIKEYYETYAIKIKNIYTKQPQQENIPKMEEHYLMQILKHEAKPAYEYLKKAIKIQLVQYTAMGYFNFLCDKGCVGYFFLKAGYTDFKRISPYILINEEPCDVEILRNGSKHGKTDEWYAINKAIFCE